MTFINENSEIPFKEVFDASREIDTLYEGGKDVYDIESVVDKTIFRSPDGYVRGVVAGGEIITIQNDRFKMSDNGEPEFTHLNEGVDTHEALPMETTEYPELEINGDGCYVEASTASAEELFDGEIMINQPMLLMGEEGQAPRVVVAIVGSSSDTLIVGGYGNTTTETAYDLYDPFLEGGTENAHTFDDLITAVSENGFAGFDQHQQEKADNKPRNYVGSVGTASNSISAKNLRYITDISKNHFPIDREDHDEADETETDE